MQVRTHLCPYIPNPCYVCTVRPCTYSYNSPVRCTLAFTSVLSKSLFMSVHSTHTSYSDDSVLSASVRIRVSLCICFRAHPVSHSLAVSMVQGPSNLQLVQCTSRCTCWLPLTFKNNYCRGSNCTWAYVSTVWTITTTAQHAYDVVPMVMLQ